MARSRLDSLLNILLTVAALAIAVVLVRREVRGEAPNPATRPPELLPGWEALLRDAVVVGPSDAKVTVLEFMDVQCPFCREWQLRLDAAVGRHRGDVRTALIHFPLDFHPHARSGARAIECAAEVGRSAEFVSATYRQQDSIGPRPWQRYAHDAGIADTLAFNACLARPVEPPRVARGPILAESLDVLGTPTVFVNGWRVPVAPDSAELDRVIAAVRRGEVPYRAKGRLSRWFD